MSPKRKRFCEEYAVDFNGKRAAMRAGYSPKSATVQASMMLDDPEVQVYLAKLTKKQQERIELTAQRVLDELARLAFHDIGSYYRRNAKGALVLKDIDDLTLDQRAAVAEYDPAKNLMRLYSKDPSLDKLGKHFKLFTELHEQQHTFTVMPELKLGGKTLIFNVGEPVKKK